MERKKRGRYIILAILAALLVAIASVMWWQRENIKALHIMVTADSESIAQSMDETQQKQETVLKENFDVTLPPINFEQANDLLNGKIDPDELKEDLGITERLERTEPTPEAVPEPVPEPVPPSSTVATTPVPTTKPTPTPAPELTPELTPAPEPEQEMSEEERQRRINDLVERCVAELYAREIDLMAQLGQMKDETLEMWEALPSSERNNERKMEVGIEALSKCYELEIVVDKDVKAILKSYEEPLESLGADTAVLNELWKYYNDKKASTKAYYMEEYLE